MLYCLLFDKDGYKINTHHDKVHNRLSLATFDPVFEVVRVHRDFFSFIGDSTFGAKLTIFQILGHHHTL